MIAWILKALGTGCLAGVIYAGLVFGIVLAVMVMDEVRAHCSSQAKWRAFLITCGVVAIGLTVWIERALR